MSHTDSPEPSSQNWLVPVLARMEEIAQTDSPRAAIIYAGEYMKTNHRHPEIIAAIAENLLVLRQPRLALYYIHRQFLHLGAGHRYSFPLYMAMGHCYEELGRYDESLKAFEFALALRTYALEALSGISDSALACNKFEQAILSLEQEICFDPENIEDNEDALDSLEAAYRGLNLNPKYTEEGFLGFERNPLSINAHKKLAYAAFVGGYTDLAIKKLVFAKQEIIKPPEELSTLDYYLMRRDFGMAASYMNAVLSGVEDPFLNRDPELARDIARACFIAAGLTPKNWESYIAKSDARGHPLADSSRNFAILLAEKGHHHAAERALLRLEQADAESIPYIITRVDVLMAAGRTSDALALALSLWDNDSLDKTICEKLGWALLSGGCARAARNYFTRAHMMVPSNSVYMAGIALALKCEKGPREALNYVREKLGTRGYASDMYPLFIVKIGCLVDLEDTRNAQEVFGRRVVRRFIPPAVQSMINIRIELAERERAIAANPQPISIARGANNIENELLLNFHRMVLARFNPGVAVPLPREAGAMPLHFCGSLKGNEPFDALDIFTTQAAVRIVNAATSQAAVIHHAAHRVRQLTA